MKLSQRAFPHPVVGNSDDVNAAFQAPIEVAHDRVNYYLSVAVQCSSKTILDLLKKGKATYVLHVECSNTLYRNAFEFTESTKEFPIPAEHLNSTVEVNVFARAKRDIPNYQVEGAHADYRNAVFEIATGDVLAKADTYTFDADIDFDALRSVGSIMQLDKHPGNSDSPMAVEFSGDKITIFLSREDYENYNAIKGYKLVSALLTVALVLPALVEGIRQIQNSPSDYAENRWCRCLHRRIEQMGLSMESDPLELAQKVLQLPVKRAFLSTRTALESGE